MLIPYLIVIAGCYGFAIITRTKFEFPYYWYLDFMLFWYAVYFVVIKIPGTYNKRYWILGVASLAAFLCGSGIRAEQAVSFLFGVWISDHFEKTKKIIDSRWLMLCAVIGVLILGVKQIPMLRNLEDSLIWYGMQLVMKLSLAVVILGTTQKFQGPMNNKLIALAGVVSYEFYLVHYRLLALPSSGIIGMVIFIILSILLSIVLNKIILLIRKRF